MVLRAGFWDTNDWGIQETEENPRSSCTCQANSSRKLKIRSPISRRRYGINSRNKRLYSGKSSTLSHRFDSEISADKYADHFYPEHFNWKRKLKSPIWTTLKWSDCSFERRNSRQITEIGNKKIEWSTDGVASVPRLFWQCCSFKPETL